MSTAKQADGSSEERQAEPAKAYACGVGMELDATTRDIGVSGTGKNRKTGALSAFLSKIQRGEIAAGSIVYIEAIDRLSREKFDDAYTTMSSILKADINIYDAEDEKLYTRKNINEPNVISALVQKITGAHEYSKRLSRRIIVSKDRVLKQAKEEGRKLTKVCPGWLRLVDGEFELIEDRVAVVQQLFEWALSGIGTPTMAMRLNEARTPQFTREAQGHIVKKPVGGKGWSAAHITQILQSRTVLGEHQPITKRYMNEDETLNYKEIPNGPPIAGYYPAIIDRAIFDRAQIARKSNVKGSNRNLMKPNSRINNLFSGKVVCSFCGGPCMLITSNKMKKGYMYCTSFIRKNGCTAKGGFSYEILEREVLRRLASMDSEGRFSHAGPVKAITDIQAEATRLQSALEAGEQALLSWMGEAMTDRMKRLRAAKEAELDAIESKLKDLQRQLEEASTISLADQASTITRLATAAQAGNVEARLTVRMALRGLIDHIELDVVKKHAEIYCANGFIFIVYGNGYTVDIETGGPAETLGRLFTIRQPE